MFPGCLHAIPGDDRPAVTIPGDDRPAVTIAGDDRPAVTIPGDDRPAVTIPGDDRPAMTQATSLLACHDILASACHLATITIVIQQKAAINMSRICY